MTDPLAAEPLRILHVNKFSRVVGGVETHMRQLAEIQEQRGHEVGFFSLDDVEGSGFDVHAHGVRAKVSAIGTLLWSQAAKTSLDDRLEAFRPDVVHFHNIYHHLSASVLVSARRSGAATVLTLHDYKIAAPCYLLFRDGNECHECLGKRVPAPSVVHACVKDSKVASATCAVEQVAHRPAYRRSVDAFIAPSLAARRLFAESQAVPIDAVHVVPHGLIGVDEPVDLATAPKRIVFFGRLSPEKGVATLVQAWNDAQLPDPWELVIAGDGSEREVLEQAAGPGVTFLGHCEGDELHVAIRGASASVVPSLFPETFGLSAAEAMAHGLPTIVSRVGNLPDLVGDDAAVCNPGDAADWARALRWVAESQERRVALGTAARQRIAEHYDRTTAAERTETVYLHARAPRGGRRGPLVFEV